MELFKNFSRHGIQNISRFSTSTFHGKQNEPTSSESTINQKGIDYFSSITNIWWDAEGELKGLHTMNDKRIPFVKDGLMNTGYKLVNSNRPFEGLKFLDVGCGGGILTESLAKMGAQVTGLDASKDMLFIAREHAALDENLNSNLKYVDGTIEDLSIEEKNKYDAIIASEVLEHVNNHELFLKSCVEVLKPNGSLFITTFDKNFVSWIRAIIVAEYILKYIPKGTHDWNQFISLNDTTRLLQKYNCQPRLTKGILYNPWNYRWKLVNSTMVRYAIHAVKK